MLVISHRGNLDGPSEEENSPDYILAATKKYHVEVDVWKTDEGWFLGHDSPKYLIDPASFFTTEMWCHCKNLEAVAGFLELESSGFWGVPKSGFPPHPRWFWHETDKLTLTSWGELWGFPSVAAADIPAVVVDHGTPKPLPGALGVCTDYPDKWAIYDKEMSKKWRVISG